MADHLVVVSFIMRDMDGTPEQSAEIVASDWEVMRDYWQDVETEFSAGELEPTPISDTMVLHRGTGTYFALSEAEFVKASEIDDES